MLVAASSRNAATGHIRAAGRSIGSRWRTGSIRRWAEWWRRSLRL